MSIASARSARSCAAPVRIGELAGPVVELRVADLAVLRVARGLELRPLGVLVALGEPRRRSGALTSSTISASTTQHEHEVHLRRRMRTSRPTRAA